MVFEFGENLIDLYQTHDRLQNLLKVPAAGDRRPFILQRNQWRHLLGAYRDVVRQIDNLLARILRGPLEALLLAMKSAELSLTECIAPHIYETRRTASSVTTTADPSASASDGDDAWMTEEPLLAKEHLEELELWLLQKALKHALGNEVPYLHMDNVRTCSIALIEALANYSAADLNHIPFDPPPPPIPPTTETFQSADLVALIGKVLDQGGSESESVATSNAIVASDSETSCGCTVAQFVLDNIIGTFIGKVLDQGGSTSTTTPIVASHSTSSSGRVAQFVLDRLSFTSDTNTMMLRLKVDPKGFSDENGFKKRLGNGAFGEVLEKKWMLDKHHVAVKVMEIKANDVESCHTASTASSSVASTASSSGVASRASSSGVASRASSSGVASTRASSSGVASTTSSSSGFDPSTSGFSGLFEQFCGFEVRTQARVYHPNLLPLLCFTEKLRSDGYMVIGLVSELMLYDLDELIKIRNKEKAPFPLHVAVDIMLQIAKGMEYLHQHNIMHRDLKPQNILISPDSIISPLDNRLYVRLKVADFGSSKAIGDNSNSEVQSHTANEGTGVWRAPEVLDVHYSQPTTKYNKMADVYSFAMVCYQVLTGKVPFNGDNSLSLRYKIKEEHYRPSFDSGGSSSCPEDLIDMITRCWDPKPSQRLNFREITKFLRYMKVCTIRLAGYEEDEELKNRLKDEELKNRLKKMCTESRRTMVMAAVEEGRNHKARKVRGVYGKPDTLVTRSVGMPEKAEDMSFLPGIDSLGCGYDVLNGHYADTQSCKTNLFIFNTSDLVQYSYNGTSYAAHKSISVLSATSSTLSVVSGDSIESFTSSLCASVSVDGSYGAFSAYVKASIGESTARSVDNHFTRVQENIRQYTLQLPPTSQRRSFLRPEILNDIDTATDLDQLFKDYGTHYVAGLLMGGRATYSCSTRKTKFHSRNDIKLVAQMSYQGLAGSLGASVETQYKQDIDSFRANSQKKVETRGGDPLLGGGTYVENPQEWKSSVAGDVAFVDFLTDGLVGIWELASTPKRRDELIAHYPQYCKRYGASFKLQEPYLRAKVVPLLNAQFNDGGSRAKLNLTAAVPDVGNGWYYLGQVAIGGEGAALSGADKTIVVKEVVENSGILIEVDHWEPVWTDKGSGLRTDYAFWRGVTGDPINYCAVGDFFHVNSFQRTASWPRPSAEETAGIRAVHRSCLVPATLGTQIWNSTGMPSNCNSSSGVWTITATTKDSIHMKSAKGPFVSAPSSTDVPQRPVYILRASAVVFEED